MASPRHELTRCKEFSKSIKFSQLGSSKLQADFLSPGETDLPGMSFLLPSWTSLCLVLRPVSAKNNFMSEEKNKLMMISCASFSRYVLNLMDTYGAGFAVIWIALWEVICLMWIYGVCNFSKVTEKKPFANFLWTLFIPGHIAHDWLATVYSDQSLLGFCLSCCPAGEILAHIFKAFKSFFHCKREIVFMIHM